MSWMFATRLQAAQAGAAGFCRPPRLAPGPSVAQPVAGRSASRGEGRANELLVVAAGDLHERLPIGELLVWRREPQGPSRLPALAEEPLNPRGPEQPEQS